MNKIVKYIKVLDYAKDEPFPDYLKQAKNCLSSHAFIEYMKCPLLWKRRKEGMIPFKDKKSWVLGRAAHKLILEGEDPYQEEYQVGGGPINEKTGQPYGPTTIKYKEWLEKQDKIILTVDQGFDVRKMNFGVENHKDAVKMISEGEHEKVIRVEHLGLHYQIRMDCFNPAKGLIDLKTCQDLDLFEESILKFKYLEQMAFYSLVIEWASGLSVPVHLIAIEKQEPFRCGVFHVSAFLINKYKSRVLESIEEYKENVAAETWPTRYEGVIRFGVNKTRNRANKW